MRQLAFAVALLLSACQSTPAVVDADPELRAELFAPIQALEGRWRVETPHGPGEIEFQVSSAGTVVRELMFPGDEHEMTNMYTLDGNAVVMTHYCASGNQPHMRATRLDGNVLAFESTGVSDLKAPDEHYMAALTVEFVDEDTIRQQWTSVNAPEGEDETGTFVLTRLP